MTIYQRLLQYYLDSPTYFSAFIPMFFEAYFHFGECADKSYADAYLMGETSDTGRFYFESTLYRVCVGREKDDGGYYLHLSDTCIRRYFAANITDEHRFAIVFAHWYRLFPAQIGNLVRQKKNSWSLLQYYLCNRDKLGTMVPHENRYGGSYYVNRNGREEKATLSDGGLILERTGERLEIL